MARQAVLELIADASKLQSTLKTAEGHTDTFGSKMGALGGVVAGALTGAALVSFGKSAVTAFTESEQAQSKLNLALANSPATVGVTAAAFDTYNSILAKKTLVDDDALASGQAVLAGFGLTEAQLKQMTPVLADYAAKTGKDIPGAAEDLGKAILGQGRALKGIGVEFEDTGDAGGNFAQIMDKVGGTVSGAAKAQLDAAGPGATMKKSMDELQESVGKILVPALQGLADIVSTIINFFTGLSDPIKIAIGVVGALATAIWVIVTAKKAWVAIQAALNVVMALNPITLIVIAIVALVAIIVIAYQKSETFRDIVNGAFNAVKDVVMGVFNWVKENWPLLLAILTGPIGVAVLLITTHWDTIKNAFTAVKDWIFEKIGDIVTFFTELPGKLVAAVGDLFGFVYTKFKEGWASAVKIGDTIQTWLGELPGKMAGWVGAMFGWIWDKIKAGWDAAVLFGDEIQRWLGELPGKMAGWAGSLFGWIWDKIKAGWDSAVKIGDTIQTWLGELPGKMAGWAGSLFGWIHEKFKTGWNKAVEIGDTIQTWIGELPGKILGWIGDVGSLLYDVGKKILQSLLNGLKAGWDAVSGFVGGLGSKIVGLKGPPAADAVMLVKSGRLLMDGLRAGMARGWGDTEAWLSGITASIPDVTAGASLTGATATPIATGGGAGRAGGSVVLHINVTAIDPAAASEAVITAIKEYERRNGTDWRVA